MSARILVVDDEPALRRTLERALRNLDYEVVSVGDPHLAYELLDAADYDLVMLDIHLPQMSGDTLAIALLRRWPRLAGPDPPHDRRSRGRSGPTGPTSCAAVPCWSSRSRSTRWARRSVPPLSRLRAAGPAQANGG